MSSSAAALTAPPSGFASSSGKPSSAGSADGGVGFLRALGVETARATALEDAGASETSGKADAVDGTDETAPAASETGTSRKSKSASAAKELKAEQAQADAANADVEAGGNDDDSVAEDSLDADRKPGASSAITSSLPTALLAALASGASARTAAKSDLTKPTAPADPAAAPEQASDAPAPARTRSVRHLARGRDDAEMAARDTSRAAPKEKSADASEVSVRVSPTKSLPATAAQPLAAHIDASPPPTTGAPPPGTFTPPEGQTSEVRIPLSPPSAHTAATAPALLIRVHAREGTARSIEIRLDPPELGIVDVKLETGKDGRLSAVLSTERSDAFELLKRESGALEAALREAGIALDEGAITFSLADNGAGSSWAEAREEYAGAANRREGAIEEASQMDVGAWRDGVLDISV